MDTIPAVGTFRPHFLLDEPGHCMCGLCLPPTATDLHGWQHRFCAAEQSSTQYLASAAHGADRGHRQAALASFQYVAFDVRYSGK